jgi:hypothetical protein
MVLPAVVDAELGSAALTARAGIAGRPPLFEGRRRAIERIVPRVQ